MTSSILWKSPEWLSVKWSFNPFVCRVLVNHVVTRLYRVIACASAGCREQVIQFLPCLQNVSNTIKSCRNQFLR